MLEAGDGETAMVPLRQEGRARNLIAVFDCQIAVYYMDDGQALGEG